VSCIEVAWKLSRVKQRRAAPRICWRRRGCRASCSASCWPSPPVVFGSVALIG